MRICQLLNRDINLAVDLYLDGMEFATKEVVGDNFYPIAVQAINSPDTIWWTILDDNDDVAAFGGFERVDWLNKTAEPYIAVLEKYRKKGLGMRLGKYMLEEALGLGLRRIQTIVLENSPSIPILERLGFECEGTLKEIRKYKGEFVDAHIYAYLRRSP